MSLAEQAFYDNKHLIDLLTVNYESIIYVPCNEDETMADFKDYRNDSKLDGVLYDLFNGNEKNIKDGNYGEVLLFEEDRDRLWDETRKNLIVSKLKEESVYYVFFRALVNSKLHYFKMKYAADMKDGKLVGVALALIDNGIIEKIKRRKELEMYQVIDNAERTIMEKNAELRERTLALSIANTEIIDLLGNVVEFRNRESGLHIKRVKILSRVLAEQMMRDYPEYGLSAEMVDIIVSASPLHDVGKIMVPDSILLKQGRLTPEERKEMQKHCDYGAEILRSASKSWTSQYSKIASDICSYHHEKWDGNGYPNGLKGDEIPIAAQIVSAADCYEALTSKRVYKPAYTPEKSMEMILNGECGEFSEKILCSLRKCKSEFARIVENPEEYHEKEPVQLSGENKLNGLKILLVDDSEINLDLNCDILENEGAIITTVDGGVKAIDTYLNDGPFDAIIMDIVMPGMSGIEATKKIREIERNTGHRTPIIALSAEGVDHNTFIETGFDASMAKPLIVGEITRILLSCLHNTSVQMQKQLAETLKIANTDALTKVKNVAAYFDMTASMNNEIKEGKILEFALVVTDINDLKGANDSYGHEIGNVYIKNCCKLLCDVFKSSPVYRIGGDEFVVVLQGEEYYHREQRIELLKEKLEKAEEISEYADGRASFAIGMSEYIPSVDTEVGDVQRRADTAMYLDKKNRKGIIL